MEQKLWRIVLAVVSALALTGVWAGAQAQSGTDKPAVKTDKPAAETATPDIQERALSILKRANDFLVQAQHFSVTVVDGYDTVQVSGVKIEYGATRKYTIRRPDRVRLDTEQRNGNQRGFRFDGKEIAVFDSDQKVYATAEHPGTLDEAFNYFVDQLQMPLPLSQLFSSTFGMAIGAGIALGTALTASAFSALTCTPTTVVVGGVSYYNCGGTWYNRGYQGGNVTYIVVNAPAGY